MAVYTLIPRETLEVFLAGYDLGALLSVEGIAEGVENTNYRIRTEQCQVILTLFEKRVSECDLPWFMGLMQHLAAHGLACPKPVAARDGQVLRTLEGRPCAITTFLPGRPVETINASACYNFGQSLARLHLMGEGFDAQRRNALGPGSWAPLLQSCGIAGEALRSGLTALLDRTIGDIVDRWPAAGSLPSGQIHADLFPDNVFFKDGRVSGLIDFYFACTDYYAYDLAICLNAWCFPEEVVAAPGLTQALIAGYQHIRPLESDERLALPVLVQGAATRFLLTRLYDWVNTPAGALVTRKDPLAYLHRLQDWQTRGEALLHA